MSVFSRETNYQVWHRSPLYDKTDKRGKQLRFGQVARVLKTSENLIRLFEVRYRDRWEKLKIGWGWERENTESLSGAFATDCIGRERERVFSCPPCQLTPSPFSRSRRGRGWRVGALRASSHHRTSVYSTRPKFKTHFTSATPFALLLVEEYVVSDMLETQPETGANEWFNHLLTTCLCRIFPLPNMLIMCKDCCVFWP
jgi:hypothetical protein